ncbi:MAG: hypothetical protein AAF798_10265 [Bacteroidota bacterium]
MEILRHLQPQEREDLVFFCQMPSNKVSPKKIGFFKQLLELSLPKNGLSEESIWRKVLLEEAYKTKNKVSSSLLSVVYRYLGMLASEATPLVHKARLAKLVNESRMMDNARVLINKVKIQARAEQNRSYENYLALFYIYELEIGRAINDQTRVHKLKEMYQALSTFFVIHLLRIIGELANRHHVFSIDKSYEELLIKFQSLIDEIDVKEVQIMKKMIALIIKRDFQSFEQLLEVHEQNPSFFIPRIQHEIINRLFNFCVYQTNINNFSIADHYFDLGKRCLALQPITPGGHVNIPILKNLITTAININNIDLARDFYEQQVVITKTAKDKRSDSLLLFSEGMVLYAEGKYDQSLTVFNKYIQTDYYLKYSFYKMQVDKLLIRLQYDLKHYSIVMSSIESMRSYINSDKKLSKDLKNLHKTFLQLLRKMVTHKPFNLEKKRMQLTPYDYKWIKSRTATKL